MPIPDVDLDPADFVIVPNVYVVDEFDMTDDEGNIVARIDAKFIAKTVARMQQREAETGDLCPIVVGHTEDNPQGADEINGPPLIGYFRNWKQLPFFDTGRTAAAPDAWIFKSEVERAKKFPRRSSEVWVTRHEIDPVSFLGATTPARDLGLLKLSRSGTLNYTIGLSGNIFDRPVRLDRTSPTPTNRESDMAEKKDDKKPDEKPKADPAQSGESKTVEGKLDQLISMFQEWMAKAGGAAPAAPAADAGAAAPAAGAGGEGDGELSDDELNQYLAQMGGEGGEGGEGAAAAGEPDEDEEKSRKGEKPVKNSTGYAGGNDTHVANADVVKKLSRVEEELEVTKMKLARKEIKDRLRTAVDQDGANLDPTDEKLISDLAAMPEDMRENMVVRLSRNKSKTANTGHADAAHRESTNAGVKKIRTPEDQRAVMKLARQKNIGYEVAATELGFVVG